jgi:hypothetical protein
MGPNLEFVTLITVGPVGDDPESEGAVPEGAVVADDAASGWVPGGCVAVEEWLDVPPPQAAITTAAIGRSRSRRSLLMARGSS